MRIIVQPVRRWWRTLPRLVRFLLVNCAIGIAGGWTLLAALIATDTAHLRTLIWNSSSPAMPILLLAAGFAITFGSAAMGAAVMAMRPGDDDDE
ncbi:MAG: hypothetical protein ACLPWS_22715 [Rhodomicrobium sp.]